jgi:hypothetical protein
MSGRSAILMVFLLGGAAWLAHSWTRVPPLAVDVSVSETAVFVANREPHLVSGCRITLNGSWTFSNLAVQQGRRSGFALRAFTGEDGGQFEAQSERVRSVAITCQRPELRMAAFSLGR